MTERKPAGMSFETWVDKQIREAEQRGEFTGLPGAGKPIPGRGQPDDELWWLKQYMAREKLDFALPTGLRLRKEIEDIDVRVARERQEPAVRGVVEDLNTRIRRENLTPSPGPALNRMPLDVEQVVARWRAARATPKAPEPAPPEPEAPRPSRWRRRPRRAR